MNADWTTVMFGLVFSWNLGIFLIPLFLLLHWIPSQIENKKNETWCVNFCIITFHYLSSD